KEANYTLDFIGCGYITVDGVTYYTYGDDQSKAVVANVKEVALEFAKSVEYLDEIVGEVPAAEKQINAYISAWDFNAKLFDPENDFRRFSYAGTKYNYDSVVDASTLGFAGKDYTGKAIKLKGLDSRNPITLAISGSEHYEKLINSGEYDYISMYVALDHNGAQLANDVGWYTANGNGLFGGTESILCRNLSLSQAGSYKRWTKLSLPIEMIKDDAMFSNEANFMNLLRVYTAEANWQPDTTLEADKESNYTIYVGEIFAEKEEDNDLLLDPDGSLGNVSASSTSSYNGKSVKATAEELAGVTGDYEGGALKVSMKGNTMSTFIHYDEQLETKAKEQGYKYVSITWAALNENTGNKWISGGTSLINDLVGEAVKIAPNLSTDEVEMVPLSTWMTYIVAIEDLFDRTLEDVKTGKMSFARSSSGSNWGSGVHFLFGEIKMLKEAPVPEGTLTGTTKHFNSISTTESLVEGLSGLKNLKLWDGAVMATAVEAQAEELTAMVGYSAYNGSAQKATVKSNKNGITLSASTTALNMPYYLARLRLSSYLHKVDYKYFVTYVAVTGAVEENSVSFAAGLFKTANGKAVKFGGDGYSLNTWYKVVIPIKTLANSGDISTSWGEVLLKTPTVSAGEVGDFAVYIGEYSLVTEAPADYTGSWITALPTANA
ncbi:MAG: hypothetical protein IKB30_01885, partial [Clostridia bacterium]|nr:hypothetical protein [Clostridia bacterium]